MLSTNCIPSRALELHKHLIESSELFWEVGIYHPSIPREEMEAQSVSEPKGINNLTKILIPVCLSPKSLPFPFTDRLLRRFQHAKEKLSLIHI